MPLQKVSPPQSAKCWASSCWRCQRAYKWHFSSLLEISFSVSEVDSTYITVITSYFTSNIVCFITIFESSFAETRWFPFFQICSSLPKWRNLESKFHERIDPALLLWPYALSYTTCCLCRIRRFVVRVQYSHVLYNSISVSSDGARDFNGAEKFLWLVM